MSGPDQRRPPGDLVDPRAGRRDFIRNHASIGNRARGTTDHVDVDCSDCREALSARLDGEDAPLSAERVARHLDECAACQQWQHDASRLTATLRIRTAEPVPDLTDTVLGTATARPRRRNLPRVLLICVAVCQLGLGIAQTFGLGHHAMTGAAMSGHLFNESTAWNLALGLGLLISAIRTHATAGLVPVLAAFLLVLTGFSAADLLGGHVPVSRLISHGFLVLGFVLLLIVRHHRRPAPNTNTAPAPPSTHDGTNPIPSTMDESGSAGARRPDLRPVNDQRAA